MRPLVIVVEPEPFIRLDIAATLEDLDFEVFERADAQSAAQYLAESREPALMITAIRMRGELNGHGLIAKARQRWATMPCIILSAGDADRSLSNAITYWLQKPFSPDEIERLIRLAICARREA